PAPSSLTTPNSSADDCSSTPSPAIAAADRQNSPHTLPSVDQIAVRGPQAMLLRNASNVAGPGLRMATAATAVKATRVWACMACPLSRRPFMRRLRPTAAQGFAAPFAAATRSRAPWRPAQAETPMPMRSLPALTLLALAAAGAHAQDAAAGGMAFQ